MENAAAAVVSVEDLEILQALLVWFFFWLGSRKLLNQLLFAA